MERGRFDRLRLGDGAGYCRCSSMVLGALKIGK
jgi:hypothetical protein